jgi:hypothetical protein
MRTPIFMAAIALAGCGQAEAFKRTDPSYQPVSRNAPSQVYFDRAPAGSYRSVGIIVVDAPMSTPRSEVAARAARKGGSVGCELLVSTPLLDREARLNSTRFLLVHGGSHGETPMAPTAASQTAPPEDPVIRYEFICGVEPRLQDKTA